MQFASPKDNVLRLKLKPGMKVADLGAGSGHYAFSAARLVGETGRVYVIDIQEELLARIEREATQENLHAIQTIWADIEKDHGTTLRDEVMDAVILSNTLFQLSDKKKVAKEIKRILKKEGMLLVVDWAGSYEGLGPAKEWVCSEKDAEEIFIDAGFYKVESFRGGPHHYAILFKAP